MGNSTGPRTPRGKARASQNAAKHWIESGRILPGEQQEAAILRNGFTEDFKPQSLIEREIIEDLTLNRLIRRRIDLAFTRELSKARTEKTVRLLEDNERPAIQYWLRLAGPGGGYWPRPAQPESVRPDRCIEALEVLKRQISDRGPQLEDLATLRRIFGDRPTEQAALAVRYIVRVVANQTVQGDKAVADDQETLKKCILEALQAEIEMQKTWDDIAKHVYAIEFASDVQEPPRPTLETLLRYRGANTREFKDLLDSLERIRRLRRSTT